MDTWLRKHGYFWTLAQQRDKKLDYVEDVKKWAKYEEIIALENGVSKIFDRKGTLIFLPLNVHVNNISLETRLFLKDVNNIPGVRGNMEKLIEKAMNMILRDVTVLKFKEYG